MATPRKLSEACLPARYAWAQELPWIPSGTAGKSSKPLRFLPGNRGFVELPRHDHDPRASVALHGADQPNRIVG